MNVLEQFDPVSPEILRPSEIIRPHPDAPEICVSCFNPRLTAWCVETFHGWQIPCPAEREPFYVLDVEGCPIGYYQSQVGAPACVALAEEFYALGMRKLLLFGTAGALDNRLEPGHVVLPTSAVRDEGTSYHYAPPSEEIALNPDGVNALERVMREMGVPCERGKTWTTDAIFRETRDKAAARRKQGCITVEMECASMTAWAAFRGADFRQFLYAADNLDAPAWEPRILMNTSVDEKTKYMVLALDCARRMWRK